MNYIQTFKDYLFALKPTPSKITVKNYSIDVKHFISWAESTLHQAFSPQEITVSHIEQFKKDREQQLSLRSLERHISSLRKFFQALKMQGIIAENPFETAKKAGQQIETDPFYLKRFKDFLYVYNASNLTIKNYIIDVRQFLNWAQEVTKNEGVATENLLSRIDEALVTAYRDRLHAEHIFSPASINRKLSSLRKYINWAASQNLMHVKEAFQTNLNALQTNVSTFVNQVPEKTISEAKIPVVHKEKPIQKPYSSFPPIRLAQKLTKASLMLFDTIITSPLAYGTRIAQKAIWHLRGKPLFTKSTVLPVTHQPTSVKNLSKSLFAPLTISLSQLPWHKKLIFHARNTRPDWYKRYHSYAISHYFHWAILMIFMTAIGFGFYNNFVEKPKSSQPVLAAAPPRILSFQGRLTDANNNPITTATNLRFTIYNDLTATGSALQWQEVDSVTPDTNGVFSVLLGNGTTIPQSLFGNNSSLFLGISVGQTAELTPRQQLATVAYATNAETLQGLPPITNTGNTTNVVLALDGSGNLTIGGSATPIFTASGGQFTLSGKTLSLTTVAGSNTNVQLAPDGKGLVDVQKPLTNTTQNNNIASAVSAVEVDGLFAVLATSSGQSAITVNQNGAGPIFSASSSGTSRFTIANNGALSDSNYTTLGGVVYTDASGNFLQTGTSNNTQCLIGGSAPTWTACSNIGQNYWQISNGALVPVNTTVDMFVGGSATDTAKFAVLNVNSGTPTASVSSGLNGTASYFDANGNFQTANNMGMTIGGNTTGNITLSPLNGNGTVTINGTGLILPSTGGIGGYWQLQNGALSPTNITNDVLVGSTATTSAKFAVLNMTGAGTPTASVSSGLNGNATFITADGTLQTARLQGLTIGGTTTGNITLNPHANGTVTLTGYATGIIHSTSGLLSSSALNLAGGATEITGLLPLANGGTNANLTADNGGIVYSGASGLAILAHASSVGQCLVSGGTSAPTWSSCASAASNWWSMNAGVVSPINNTLDMTLGSSDGTGSSASAKFAVLNMSGSGTPTASVSSGLNGVSTYLTATGTLATTNMQPLVLGTSTTGAINIGTDATARSISIGNITTTTGLTLLAGTGNINLNAGTIATNQTGVNLLNTTATTVNFAGAATTLAMGAGGGATINLNGTTIDDNQATLALFATPTTINLGASGQTVNVKGNVTLGTNQSNTITPNGLLSGDLIPGGVSGTYNLGSGTHFYNTVYANNFVAPISGGTSGFWSLTNDVIFPVNTYFDLAIGGTSTASADWQVFSENVGGIVGGTATASGNLSFRGAATKLNLLNGAVLDVQTSVGGDAGLASVLNIANNGNITATGNITTAGNVAVNGGSLSTTALAAGLFNTTATTVNIAGGASTAFNLGHASGTNLIRGNTTLGTASNTINVPSQFISSLIPNTTNSYDLGSNTLAWNNLYISGNYAGFWQRFSGVVSPYNITDDLAIGGTATSGAKFQVFGNTGNATTTGTLTFTGVPATIQTTSMIPLTIGSATTGPIQLSPKGTTGLFVASTGNVGIGTTLPTAQLQINPTVSTTPGFVLNAPASTFGNPQVFQIKDDSGTQRINYDNVIRQTIIGGGNKSIWNSAGLVAWTNDAAATALRVGGSATSAQTGNLFEVYDSFNNTTNALGNLKFAINPSGTISTASISANTSFAGLVVDNKGAGDLFTASTSGLARFTIANDGTIKNSLIPNITDTYNLGSDPNAGGKEWNNLYVRQIITPATGGIAGFWQLNSSVIAPSNITNDLAIGATATGSATPFQIFANTFNTQPAGTASTAGNLTFRGTPGSQTVFKENLLNNSNLGFYPSVGGDAGIGTPTLYIANTGNVGIGTSTPQGTLHVVDSSSNDDLVINQSAATNMLTNPSFETTISDWTQQQGGTGGTWAQSSAQSYVGNKSLLITTGTAFTAAYQTISVSASTTYTLSAWVKTSTASNARLVIFDVGTSTNTFSSYHTGNGAWQRLSVTVTTGNATTSIQAKVESDVNAATAYYDAVQVEQASSASPYLDGSMGPGYAWTGTPNASTSIRAADTLFSYESLNSAAGLGASSRSIFPTLQLDQDGTGDIIAASAAGSLQFKVSNTGTITASAFQDLQNNAYLLDPAATGTSLNLAGSASVSADLTFYGQGITHNIYAFNQGNLDFQVSPGGSVPTTGVVHALYLQASTGYVGIGTTSPNATLQIGDYTSSRTIQLTTNDGNSTGSSIVWAEDPARYIRGRYNSLNNYLVFENDAGSPLLSMTRGGTNAVGINTTAPTDTLQVNGKITIQSGSTGWFDNEDSSSIIKALFNGAGDWLGIQADSSNMWSLSDKNAQSSTLGGIVLSMKLSGTGAGGNVGIGVAAGTPRLTVAANSGTGTMKVDNECGGNYTAISLNGTIGGTCGTGYNILSSPSDTNLYLNVPTGGNIFFRVNNGTGMEMNSSGNVAVGGQSPSYKFDVQGSVASNFAASIQNNNGSGYGIRDQIRTTGTPTDFMVFYSLSGSSDWVNGWITGTAGGGASYNSSSDIRLKENIVDTHYGINDLMKVRVADFNYIKSPNDPTTGFLAQQLYTVFPPAVTVGSSGSDISKPWAVDYGRLTPLIIKGVQEQQVQIASIAAQMQQLTSYTASNSSQFNFMGTPNPDFTVPTYYTLTDLFGNPIQKFDAFLGLIVGNLRAGSINAQQILANTLAISTDSVSIAGQSLKNYILSVVQNAGFTTSTLSPIASVDQLHTNLISPLASGSAIAIDLTGSKFTIRNSATGSAVASIDNAGNATFSGTLNSQNLAVNSDATVSGTLRAHKIVADDIEGLSAIVGTLSAQNITNVNNIYFASPSSTPNGGNIAMGFGNPSSTTSALPNSYAMSYANVASYSSYLAYVPNLSAATAIFDQGLSSLGPTVLSDTTITGQLSVGVNLTIANNSINVLGQSLEIQPLRQGGVNFEGGLLAIDTDGNLTVNGNAVFAKNLAAHMISPLSNTDNLTFQLGQNPTASGAALATANLSVQNASGSGIFSIDQLGNVIASGAANIAKLNFNLVQPALAVSDTEVIATGSAGTALIKPHHTEITIDNPQITSKSLIYITPVGQSVVTPYLIRQVDKTSFTVGVSLPQNIDTNFNWLIVN